MKTKKTAAAAAEGRHKSLWKKLLASAAFLLAVLVFLCVGPLDAFTHGFYAEELDLSRIGEADWGDCVPIDGYEMEFQPRKDHMAGFSLLLRNLPSDASGAMVLTVSEPDGRSVEEIRVDLSKVTGDSWYKVYLSSRLKKGHTYRLSFALENPGDQPQFQTVLSDYLPRETLTGNILLAYAYKNPTFTKQERILICALMPAICFLLIGAALKKRSGFRWASLFIILSVILAWNYTHNSMDNTNTTYSTFSSGSECLVSSAIYAEKEGVYFLREEEYGYGLGRYCDKKGSLNAYGKTYATDAGWDPGYSRTAAAVVVNSNQYTKDVAVAGNYLRFANGEIRQISGVEDDNAAIRIFLDGEGALSPAKQGSLDDARFLDVDQTELPAGLITAYTSQYGLQGKVLRHIARLFEKEDAVAYLRLLCSVLAAFVFTAITLLIAKKYGPVFAVCFYVTFWLSPWIVNFARNLYWVEFTWFLPMAIGLFCALRVESRAVRLLSYAAIFAAITVKSLCGYEYLPAIMMGSVAFLLADLVRSVAEKDKKRALLALRTVFLIGIVSIAGFLLAIGIHAQLRGHGNIAEGIQSIFESDVLRRTSGADLNEFEAYYWDSFNASAWEVLRKYFNFSTDVIAGIPGNVFPVLCLIPVGIFAFELQKRRADPEAIALYVLLFLTSVSAICLTKGHSYIHTHLNFVLWYFGFVQVCLYLPVSRFIRFIKTAKGKG